MTGVAKSITDLERENAGLRAELEDLRHSHAELRRIVASTAAGLLAYVQPPEPTIES